jgi:multidrug efflux pump subunit AcrA (membrane-fusion protein)
MRPLSALVLLLLLAACGGTDADAKAKLEGDAPAPTTVSAENIVVVSLQPISSGPAISGALAAEREATVRAQISGPILSTDAEQGSRVAAGAVLARIDDRTIRDQFLGARSGVTTAQTAATSRRASCRAARSWPRPARSPSATSRRRGATTWRRSRSSMMPRRGCRWRKGKSTMRRSAPPSRAWSACAVLQPATWCSGRRYHHHRPAQHASRGKRSRRAAV